MRAGKTGWAISAGGLFVFAVLALMIHMNNTAFLHFDEHCAVEAQQSAFEHRAVLQFARTVTDLGDIPVMTGLAIIAAVVLLLKRQPKLALIWLLAALSGGVIVRYSKELIARPRPDETLRDESVLERNASYPSGHATGSMIGYGALAWASVALLRRRWAKTALVTAVIAILVIIAWTRIYLRAHWCSDVVGGWALGIGWLSLWIAVMTLMWKGKGGRSVAA